MIRRFLGRLAALLASGADATDWPREDWRAHADGDDELELTDAERDVVEQLRGLRDMRFEPPGIDTRAAREIHGMTVPEFTDVNDRFAAIIAALWPDHPKP